MLPTDQQVDVQVQWTTDAPDGNLIALSEIKHQNRRRKQVRVPPQKQKRATSWPRKRIGHLASWRGPSSAI